MYDTIIIGAGMSGLAAGIRLAHFGGRVCLLERHSVVGGLNSYYRRRGRAFDVGLHAVTNYAPRGARRGPLPLLLRQLRLAWDDLALAPQAGSAIAFPGLTLEFSNDFGLLEAQVQQHFPGQADALRRLVGELAAYDDYGGAASRCSAREVLGRCITDPLLREMLFCPVAYYGSPREGDMDFGQFSMIFRSIFLEGLCRPAAGVRQILDRLVEKFRGEGGQLRLRSGVARLAVRGDAVQAVVLDDGTELSARQILSSAGVRETLRLCEPGLPDEPARPGLLSCVETICVLRVPPGDLGNGRTMVFFNDSPTIDYRRPEGLVDLRSGVICSPNNFLYDRPLSEGVVRISVLANHDRWAGLDRASYRLAKREVYDTIVASAARFVPDFRPAVIETDIFTPVTIRRFTGHDQGALYGTPDKRYDGATHLKNLFLCGTDQGLVGIIGALLGGITMANRMLRMKNAE